MFTNLILSTIIFFNTHTYNISLNDNYFFHDQVYKLELVKVDKLSAKNKNVLYKWCKQYSKKRVKSTDIKNIISSVYEYSDTPLLMLAIISVESNFDKQAESVKGATGLTQVMPLWLKEFKPKYGIKSKSDLKKIDNSVIAGNHVITSYSKKTGSLAKGLNKYVNGSSAYVKKVLDRYLDLIYSTTILNG